jgi:hypothetical protein
MTPKSEFRINASPFPPRDGDDTSAVLIGHGQIAIGLSIAQARDIANRLALAADDAELKLQK